MEATFSPYNYTEGPSRIDEILNSSDSGYEDHNGIPPKDKLTYSNGYYVDVTVLFIDMRNSKALTEKHTKPVLAKILRAYISETIAVLRGNSTIRELYIEGDGVWAVFNTTNKPEVDSVFITAFTLSSAIDLLNKRLQKKHYSTINVGIGMDDGNSLYIKAGYKGSGINEIVWVGKTVGQSAKYCSMANKNIFSMEIMVSNKIHSYLSDANKALLHRHLSEDCWHGNIINREMNNWIQNNA